MLLEVSKINQGKNKHIEHIAACLIAYACRLSFKSGYDGFISLIPKSVLVEHYMAKYGFKPMGKHLYLDLYDAQFLIKKYLEDEC